MPFTLSHTVASYPFYYLSRGKLPLIALAIGCMSPDFSYFLEDLFLAVGHSHTYLAVLMKCLPVSLVVIFFLSFYQDQFIYLMPFENFRLFLKQEFQKLRWKNLFWIVLAVIVGAGTHVFWDDWTHKTGLFVGVFPFLKSIHLFNFGLYRVLQYVSTILGMIILLHQLVKLKIHLRYSWRIIYWSLIFIVALCMAVQFHFQFPHRTLIFSVVSCSIAYFSVIVLVSLIGMKAGSLPKKTTDESFKATEI